MNSDGTGVNTIWRKWVADVASHFKTNPSGVHVSAYEIWNEFTRDPDSSTDAWEGTNEQMVRLAQDARCIIAGRPTSGIAITATRETCSDVLRTVHLLVAVDTTALILSPNTGLAYAYSKWQAYYATAGASEAAEGFAIHPYPSQPAGSVAAENSYQLMATFLAGLSGADQSKPVWATEGGWGTNDQEPDTDLQAAFVARYYLLLWSKGAARNYWYDYDNSDWGTLSGKGCFPVGCLTQAGVAYQQVYNWMVVMGQNMTTQCAGPTFPATGVWTCGFTTPNAQYLAVWDSSKTCNPNCQFGTYNAAGYTGYYTLANSTLNQVSGGQVQIGAKPILLYVAITH